MKTLRESRVILSNSRNVYIYVEQKKEINLKFSGEKGVFKMGRSIQNIRRPRTLCIPAWQYWAWGLSSVLTTKIIKYVLWKIWTKPKLQKQELTSFWFLLKMDHAAFEFNFLLQFAKEISIRVNYWNLPQDKVNSKKDFFLSDNKSKVYFVQGDPKVQHQTSAL